MIGLKFGELTVIKKEKSSNNRGMWLCECSCGNTKFVQTSKLNNGHTKSCGCKKSIKYKHGYTDKERLYMIWKGIKRRCSDKKNKNYGARGISFCYEWNEYINFREWALENGYKDDLTIERIDVNGNYEPSNCTWITFNLQSQNKCNTIYIYYENNKYTLKQFSKKYNIPLNIVTSRYEKKYTPYEIVNGKKECKYMVEINSIKKSLREWCILFKFTYNVAVDNYKKGLLGNDIFKYKDTTRTKKYYYMDKNLTLTQWEKELNIKRGVLRHRINMQNLSFEEAIKKESTKNTLKFYYNGNQYLLKDLVKLLNIPYNTLYNYFVLNKNCIKDEYLNKLKQISPTQTRPSTDRLQIAIGGTSNKISKFL